MIAQFFEVETKPGHRDQYLELAASLRPALDAMGGCLFIDRFQSLSRDNLLLSYQIWQDEGAMTAWRVHARHHRIQEIGREAVFSDYRIRIAQVIHEARPNQPVWQPAAPHALQRSRAARTDLCAGRGVEECQAFREARVAA